MVFTFLNKPKSSNKTETLPVKPALAINHPKPFIDKISIIVDIPPEMAYDSYVSFLDCFDDKEFYKDAPKGKIKGFNAAKRIVLPCLQDVKKYPLVQLDYDKATEKASRMRLEFVPVDLQLAGMKELSVGLAGFIEDGWDYFQQHGRVTRIDVTVDFPEICMEDMNFIPQQMASVTAWKVNGRLETAAYGKRNGNQTLIYDRGEKRKAKKQSSEGKNGVRIECRMTKMKTLKVSGLENFPNPFVGMTFVEDLGMLLPPPELATSSQWVWAMFCDSVKIRGLAPALALLSVERRTMFRQHLNKHSTLWWKPDMIWQHWPAMLKEINFVK